MLGVGIAAAPPGPRAVAGPGRHVDARRAAALVVALRRRAAANLAIGQVAGPLAAGAAGRRAACCSCSSPCSPARPPPPPSAAPGAAAGRLALGVVVLVGVSMAAPAGPRGRHRRGRARAGRRRAGHPQDRHQRRSRCSSATSRPPTLVEPPVDLVVWPEDVIDTDGPFVDDPWADVVGDLAARARRADDRRHRRGRRPRALPQRAPCSSTPTARSSSATTRCTGCPSASTCRSARCSSRWPATRSPTATRVDRRAPRAPRRARPGRAGRHADLVGDLLPRPHPRGRGGRRPARAQPHQRLVLHRHDRADAAGGVVPDARHRERPVGRARSPRPASPRSSTTTATCSSAPRSASRRVIQRESSCARA